MDEVTVACFLMNNSGEILLQKKTNDYFKYPGAWALFGGSIEGNESPETAIKREIKEELNLDINPTFYKEIEYHIKYSNINGRAYLFYSRIPTKLSSISLGEGSGFAFFNVDEIKNISKTLPDKNIIMEGCKKWKA